MPIHITADYAAEKVANQLMTEVNEQERIHILPLKKYNVLVNAFNVSSALLATAAICTLLFAYTAAVALGALGLLIRFSTEKELKKYTLPPEQPAAQADGMLFVIRNTVRHALGHVTQQEKEDNIFARLSIRRVLAWEEDAVDLFDYSFWKNTIPEPARAAAQ